MTTPDDNEPVSGGVDPGYWTESDARFCAAMQAAIDAGKETPPGLTVFKDDRPHPPGARIIPLASPPRSYGGSSAGECAALGGGYVKD